MSTITPTLLLLALAATVCAIFAPLVPGAWWQWLLAAAVLVFGAVASAAADVENR